MSRGPKPKTRCIKGHELTPENTYQLFTKNGTKNGRACRQCNRDMQKDYRQRNPDIMYRYRIESQMTKRYGPDMSLEGRDDLLASQNYACAICGRTGLQWGQGFTDVWHIDHLHDEPGTHRGVLCGFCNLALGRLEPHMVKVIEYLAKYAK